MIFMEQILISLEPVTVYGNRYTNTVIPVFSRKIYYLNHQQIISKIAALI